MLTRSSYTCWIRFVCEWNYMCASRRCSCWCFRLFAWHKLTLATWTIDSVDAASISACEFPWKLMIHLERASQLIEAWKKSNSLESRPQMISDWTPQASHDSPTSSMKCLQHKLRRHVKFPRRSLNKQFPGNVHTPNQSLRFHATSILIKYSFGNYEWLQFPFRVFFFAASD